MDKEFENMINSLAEELDISLTDKQAEQFYKYMILLLEWNEKINLTTITKQDDIILKHFIDSLTILKYIKEKQKIIDVGTGAGFPGIPIAIMMPNVQITLLDSLNKRILFLQDVIQKLDLKNVRTIHGRAEEFARNMKERESFDIAISRAVANLSTLSEYLIPFVKMEGTCICMKGPDIDEELNDAKYAINQLGGEVEKVQNLSLPNSDMVRNIIMIKKKKTTPDRYPRKAGIPAKKPLSVRLNSRFPYNQRLLRDYFLPVHCGTTRGTLELKTLF